MTGIVCAVRGGPSSRPTISKSIQLASETGLSLYFLYVVNLDFLTRTSSSRVHLISKQMREMGEFILLTAQAEANKKGIKAENIIRQGKILEEIINVCHEKGANYVVLGKPKMQDDAENIFTHERLDEFGQQIETESGARVVLAEEET
jgi:nucleotide-binding universal stress UspA family protein